MESFAVFVFPIAKPEEWRGFVDSANSGERAEAHREFLRRQGVSREHIHHQSSPAGDLMVLVWEGVDQDAANAAMGDATQNPQSEHERYIATHVVPELHGVDLSAAPPPEMRKVATIET
jgi:hypothetical protein